MKDTDILELIKNRKVTRKYQDKPIPKELIDKILEAGIWGPSVHGFQPWKFIIITNKNLIEKISNITIKKSKKLGAGANIILHYTAKTIANARLLILVYNSIEFSKMAVRFKKSYINIAKITEIEAISAAIQNILLVAEVLGIGGCWLTTPLFCRNNINKLLNTNDELIAILTLGYPTEKVKRSSRKKISKIIKYIK